jgi:hypothetical protein
MDAWETEIVIHAGCGTILETTPELNSCIWWQIKRRNVLLIQLPISIMVNTGTISRYIVIAVPLPIEWRPTYSGPNPSLSRLME